MTSRSSAAEALVVVAVRAPFADDCGADWAGWLLPSSEPTGSGSGGSGGTTAAPAAAAHAHAESAAKKTAAARRRGVMRGLLCRGCQHERGAAAKKPVVEDFRRFRQE